MTNGLFKLGWSDVLDSVVTAVFVAVIIGLAGIVQQPNFDVFTANWGMIGASMVNYAFITLIGTLAKSFMSTNTGAVLGIGKGTGN